jgi:hypothetical protein
MSSQRSGGPGAPIAQPAGLDRVLRRCPDCRRFRPLELDDGRLCCQDCRLTGGDD